MSNDPRYQSTVLTPEVTQWGMNALRKSQEPPYGGGDGGGDGMIERIAKLEAGQDAIRREMDQRFSSIDTTLTAIRSDISGLRSEMLTKWDVAKVVAGVVGFAMALVLFGPRLIAMLSL